MTEDEEEQAKDEFIEERIAEYLSLDESWDEVGARAAAEEDWNNLTDAERNEI